MSIFNSLKSTLFMVALAIVIVFAGFRTIAYMQETTFQGETYIYQIDTRAIKTNELNDDGTAVKLEPSETLLVSISPEMAADNPNQFSEAHRQFSLKQAELLAQTETNSDTLILFSRPLSMEEANAILQKANAAVHRSSAVGIVADTPFATNEIEGGLLLARSLSAHAAEQANFPSGPNGEPAGEEAVDVRGYLAVQAVVPAEGLGTLLSNPLVDLVDVTPQLVRNRLMQDIRTRGEVISDVTIPMPVWGDEW